MLQSHVVPSFDTNDAVAELANDLIIAAEFNKLDLGLSPIFLTMVGRVRLGKLALVKVKADSAEEVHVLNPDTHRDASQAVMLAT